VQPGANPSTTFDVSKIGAVGGAQQFQGFASYQKTGAGDWTLTGTTSAVTPWRIGLGTLIISNEGNLGDPSSPLVLAGGTLQSTASLLSTSRQISLTADSEIATPSDITIAAGITGSGGFIKSGTGTLTLTGASTYAGTTTIQSGTLRVQGPAASLPVNGNITNNGTLVFDSAGTLTLNGTIFGAGQLQQIGSGTLTLSQSNLYLGGTYISGGTLNVMNGGSLGTGATSVANGTLAVAGGTLGQLTFQDGTNNTLEVINGGTVQQLGPLVVGGNLKLTSDGASATLTLAPSLATGASISTIEIGPNLTLTTSAGFDLSIAESANSIQLDAGGVWQSSATNLALGNLQGQGDLSATFLSIASGDFAGKLTATSLTKIGTGTLTLSGSDDQENGAVRVNGGKLVVDTALAPGATVTVASGATLAGKGSMGSTTIQDNAILSPGDSGGELTIHGNLTLSNQSRLAYTLGNPGTASDPASGTSSRIAVDGALRLDGILTLSPSTVPTDGTAAVGYYRLMTYGGTLDDEGVAVQAGALPAPITDYAVLAGGGHVDLSIGAAGSNTALQQWAGGSGAWDGTSPSWTNADGNVPVTWSGKIAVFKDSAGATGGTIAVQGTQTFQGMQFVDEGYALTGPGTLSIDGSANADGNAEIRVLADSARIDTTITGLGGITKTEAGTLILGGNNNYMGGTVVDAGTVQVSRDANLGSPIGALTLNGGTLQTTGVFATPRPVVLDGPGGTFQTDADLMLSGIVVGQGALIKTGSGVLTLSSGNAYQGGTIIESGTVAAFADSNLGAPTGPLAFDGGALRWNSEFDLSSSRAISLNAGGGTLDTNGHDTTIAQAMTGVGGLVKTGDGTLTLLGENTYAGGTAIDGGTIQVGNGGTSGSLIGNVANNGALIFARADDLTFGGAISGTGSLRQAGGGNLTLVADSSAFAGTTDVATGTLTVNGKLGGTLSVADGATLSGTGSVGSTVLASGATLAPGNATAPAGSLSVNGDLSFGSGSAYRVTAGPGLASNTFVHVSGTATLAGSVVHVGPEGNYAASSTFRILSADRGLHGTFDSVSSNFAFLNPTLGYTANDVDLRIDMKQVAVNPPPGNGTGPAGDQGSRPIRFADAAVTGNQRAVANALQSLPTTNGLYSRVLNLPNGAPPAVFDSLSGEAYASTVSTLQGVTNNAAALSTQHLRANLDAGLVAGPPTAQLGAGDGSALPRSAAQPVWAQVFGNWRTMAGNGDASKVEQSDGGLFIGGDHGVGKGWRVGGALGYTDTHSTVDGRSSTADVDSYSATIYGGKAFAAGIGKINFMLGAGYTWHDIKAKRNVDAAGQSQDLDADYSASTGQFFTELGYALPLNERVTLEPFVGADYSDLRTRGFSESGGDAALQGQGNRNQVAATTLGVHGQYSFESGDSQGRLRGTVGWRHAYGDVNPTTTMAFSGSQPFTVAGTPIARDSAVLELGVDMAVTKHTTVGVAYGGQFGAGNSQNTGSIDVRWSF
ncbi:MAG TPA: autotransporter domain-containing protein, partial [Bordetella sp.]|nr:autotransporter domain-containing protein [Bordetella sp.]